MRIAYVTTDEVNLSMAARMAATYRAAVCPLSPAVVPPYGQFDGVLYDLDGVPRHRRPAMLAEVLSVAPTRPSAVHGYDLSREQAEALRRCGVAVARQLDPALFRGLRRAVLRGRVTVPDATQTDLTWVNLAE